MALLDEDDEFEPAAGVAGAAAGAVDLQIDGWPAQVNPDWILQDTQPADVLFPVSQDSAPAIIPSPQTGEQMPWALAENPAVAQVMHWVADRQVLHEEPQGVHPLVLSKYCPSGQLTCLRTNRWQTPKLSM